MYESHGAKGQGIESRSFYFFLLIASFSFIRLIDIIRPINTFHGPTTLRLTRHARRDEEEEEELAGVSGTKIRERMNWFVSKTIKW